MIVVTGTKRSGTSMWMQVLIAAGFPPIGTQFPAHWSRSIAAANPRGFWESRFRNGVFYRTNPDPKTGDFLHPRQVKTHVVKVFVPGLVRSDMAYLHRVIATMRNWREYPASLRRLYEMEDRFTRDRAAREGADPEEPLAQLRGQRSKLPPAVEWWFETYDLIRDLTTRHYPFHLTTFDKVIEDPGPQVRKVIEWLGAGNADAACAAVERTLRTSHPPPPETIFEGVEAEDAAVFDELYRSVHDRGKLSSDLLSALNETQRRFTVRFGALSRERES